MDNAALTLESAQRMINAALEEAHKQQVNIAVTVVDSGGHLVAFARMDGTAYMAVDITRRKAQTANNFRMPTQALNKIAEFDPIAAADLAKNPEICTVAGGLPIITGNTCLGGLGVGGGRSDQDQSIAAKALAAIA